jgi:glycosyltransferase involved in cell wall biosynthesis
MKTVVVEGWRSIPHSYAIVAAQYCLELRRRPELTLYFRDVPFLNPAWNAVPGLLPPEQESVLRAIPAPPPDLRPEVYLRLACPHFFHNEPGAARTFVWGTSEFRVVQDDAMGVRKPSREVLYKSQATIIAPSHWAAAGFIACGAPRAKVKVVPCGVDPAIFHPLDEPAREAARKRLGWEGRFIALNVSAMTLNKGVNHLYKMAADLADRLPALTLVLKGADALYPSQQFANSTALALTPAERRAIQPRLKYVGHTLAATDLATLYQAADVYVSPYEAEGFNLPVLEAAACGLPVVCTRGGPTDDFVGDSFARRIDSRIVPGPLRDSSVLRPSITHLEALVLELAGDGAFRQHARRAGPEWVRSRFTWAHSTDALLAVLFGEGAATPR